MRVDIDSPACAAMGKGFAAHPPLVEFRGGEDIDSPSIASRTLMERFRYPEELLAFTQKTESANNVGYFRFGPEIVLYGRCSEGRGQSGISASLYDVQRDTRSSDGRLELPFNIDEVIDNLRLERYPLCSLGRRESFLKSVYYRLRPLTNQSFRRGIKQLYFRKWQAAPFPHWPVDTTVEDLCESVLLRAMRARGIQSVPFIWFWPKGIRACAMMTHDVETKAGREFCSELLEIDDCFGVKASFQIVPERRYEVPSSLLQRIRSRGFEIGIQDLNHDGRLFDDRSEFRRRVALINRYGKEYGANGFRGAVLYRRPEWYEDLDFSFDMSIPNVAHLDPQPGGCCTVMPYFIGGVLELPLTTVQDYTLLHILNEHSIALWKTQLDRIMAKHGLASFIVHPDYLLEAEARRIYEDLLRHVSELRDNRSVWVALPGEIDRWWRTRSRMKVVRHDDFWRIEGEGCEQAVLAFAKDVNGRLVYNVTEASAAGVSGSSQ